MPTKTPKIVIFDCATQEREVRDMNEEELLELEKTKIKEKEIEKEANQKEIARQAIAEKLGLTADELQVLLG